MTNDETAQVSVNCGCLIIFLLISPIISAITLPYTVNTWLVHYGKDPSFVWWYGFLLGIIPSVGYWALLAAVFTFIASFFF